MKKALSSIHKDFGFSIIIPTYKNPSGIKRLLNSLLKIKYDKNFEIIVIDNGPEQSCYQECMSFKNSLISYYHLKRQGASFARNKGISYSKYEYLLFLDDDVEVKTNILKSYARAWKRYPNHALLGGGISVVKSSDTSLNSKEKRILLKNNWIFASQGTQKDKEIEMYDTLFSANISMKKGSFLFSEALGVPLYKDIWLRAEDYELCTRVILMGKKVCLLADDDIVVTHYVDASRFTHKYMVYRSYLAGIELVCMDRQLISTFGKKEIKSYLERATSPKGICLSLFYNQYRLLILVSYYLNRLIFK